jgi:hypothetical protein
MKLRSLERSACLFRVSVRSSNDEPDGINILTAVSFRTFFFMPSNHITAIAITANAAIIKGSINIFFLISTILIQGAQYTCQ